MDKSFIKMKQDVLQEIILALPDYIKSSRSLMMQVITHTNLDESSNKMVNLWRFIGGSCIQPKKAIL